MTKGEEAFVKILRLMRISSKVKRQCVMFGYILDFFWPHKFLAFEIDGASHDGKKEYDGKRTERFSMENISVMRFTNDEVINSPTDVIRKIRHVARIKRRPIRVDAVKEFRSENFSQEYLNALVTGGSA